MQPLDESRASMTKGGETVYKGRALTRRLRELRAQGVRITEPGLAKQLGKARSTVATWKAGRAWPSPADEAALEAALGVPRGFFAQIAAGAPYAAALLSTDDAQEKADVLTQFVQLLSLPPAERPDGVYSVREVQTHLQHQITMLYKMVMPNEVITEAGIQQANALLAAALKRILRKP